MYKKKIVIIGATSCIAENCAMLWIENEISKLSIGKIVKNLQQF